VCQQKSQADIQDGGIGVASLVTSSDDSTPIDMTPDKKPEPRVISKNGRYWQSDGDSFV